MSSSFFKCPRCGHTTGIKNDMRRHLNRKKDCQPVLDDINWTPERKKLVLSKRIYPKTSNQVTENTTNILTNQVTENTNILTNQVIENTKLSTIETKPADNVITTQLHSNQSECSSIKSVHKIPKNKINNTNPEIVNKIEIKRNGLSIVLSGSKEHFNNFKELMQQIVTDHRSNQLTKKIPKPKPLCISCRIYPVINNPELLCNYCRVDYDTSKEMTVVHFLQQNNIDLIHNRSVGNICGNYRPDILTERSSTYYY